jgi:hypothetical protein
MVCRVALRFSGDVGWGWLLRSSVDLAGRFWACWFGRGGLLFQTGKLGLCGLARFDDCIELRTCSSCLGPRLHKFFEEIGPNSVKPSDLILWRGGFCCPANSKPDHCRNDDAKEVQGSFFQQLWHWEDLPMMSGGNLGPDQGDTALLAGDQIASSKD